MMIETSKYDLKILISTLLYEIRTKMKYLIIIINNMTYMKQICDRILSSPEVRNRKGIKLNYS